MIRHNYTIFERTRKVDDLFCLKSEQRVNRLITVFSSSGKELPNIPLSPYKVLICVRAIKFYSFRYLFYLCPIFVHIVRHCATLLNEMSWTKRLSKCNVTSPLGKCVQ